jgi:hypothetical protein
MTTLKHRQILLALQTGYTTCQVEFDVGSKLYTYKVPLSWNLRPTDQIIVDTPSTGYTLVRVIGVHDEPQIDLEGPYTYKWAVCKVDNSKYLEIAEWEMAFLYGLSKLEQHQKRVQVLEDARKEFVPEGWVSDTAYDRLVLELQAFDPLKPKTKAQG